MNRTHLVHRKTGSSYLFRSYIPSDLQPQFQRKQFQLSLRCGILTLSKFFASNLNSVTQSIYSSIRDNPDMNKLTAEDIKQILRVELEKSKRHAEHYYFGTNRFSKSEKFKSIAKNEEQEEQFLQDLKTNYQQTLKQFNPKVTEVLEEHGFPNVAVDSVEFKHLRDELIELRLTRHEMKRVMLEERERQNSTTSVQSIPETATTQVPVQAESSTNSLTLSELSKLFLESRVGGGYAEKTILDYQDTHRLLLEVLRDIPVDSLTHEHGRKLVQVLGKLPSNRSKKYPNHSIEEMMKLKNVSLMSDRTVTKHNEKVSALFNWAIKQGYTKENVFQGKMTRSLKKEIIEKHFTQDELKQILGDGLAEESFDKNRPERFWVTQIAAYSGARLNEVCQLNASDIRQEDGIWVISLLNDAEDKSIKTQSSNRIVPLHFHLIDTGLLDYVESVRNSKAVKLFPNLKSETNTRYGSAISRWFSRYLKNLGIKKKGKNFHSFRHTVVNHLTSKQVYESFIKELVGHSHGTMTMDVYAGRKPLEVLLNECVVKLDYGIEGEESE